MSDKYEISEISYLSAGAEIFSLPVKKTHVGCQAWATLAEGCNLCFSGDIWHELRLEGGWLLSLNLCGFLFFVLLWQLILKFSTSRSLLSVDVIISKVV